MLPKVIQVNCGSDDSAKYLLNEDWGRVTETLEKRAELSIIYLPEEIGSTMKSIEPSAVVVIEGGLCRLEKGLIGATSKLKAFAESGGTVLYCGLFSSIVSRSDLQAIFGEEGFNVGWSFGEYIGYCNGNYAKLIKASLNRNAEVYINDSLKLQSAQLPDEIDPFRPLVVAVTNPGHVLYSVVDPQVKTGKKYNAVGVMAPVGKGFVGFWGDRDNVVPQTVDVLTAMLGLPPKQQQ